MSERIEERRYERLRAHLRDGLGAAPGEEVRATLHLPDGAEDRAVARSLFSLLSGNRIDGIGVDPRRRFDDRKTVAPMPVESGDSSFLGRLGASRTDGSMVVANLDDPRTLLAVLRAGTLRQRRAALGRLAEKLHEDRALPGDVAKLVVRTIASLRDVELSYHRSKVLVDAGGAIGRDAREELAQWSELSGRVERDVLDFWEGDLELEPIAALPGDQRAQLLMRTRDLPEVVATHLAALIEGTDGTTDRFSRLAMISSVRYAGDPRLVSSLRSVLDGTEPELALESARALARTEDPRAHPALVSAYERNVVDTQRAVLAGALGLTGDLRATGYVRRLLEAGDSQVLHAALEALESLGGPEDVEAVTRIIDSADPVTVAQAVRTLGRIADGRALGSLSSLHNRTHVGAMWAEIEDAEIAIRARMELRGEEHEPEGPELTRASRVAIAKASDPATVRMRSAWDLVMGYFWLGVRALNRAVVRFESAATRRPGWAQPHVAIGLAYARRNRFAQALSAFRRAIESDRVGVERQPVVLRQLVRTFLRRAEDMDRDGRTEIARGLLEEVLALDLRRAPSALRFEVNRRHEELRRRRSA